MMTFDKSLTLVENGKFKTFCLSDDLPVFRTGFFHVRTRVAAAAG